jgi:hypothetical protein
VVAVEERGLGVALIDDDGADLRGVVPRLQLGGQALVEGERGGFRGAVVGHVRDSHVGGETGDGDDHAVVRGDHGGHEFLGGPVVRQCVDVEGEADVLLGGVEDVLAAGNAGIVDEDCGGERSVQQLN